MHESGLFYTGKCEYPEVHHNNIVIRNTSFPALNGSTATFHCPLGYVISGQSEAICSNGEWIPDPRNVECIGKHTKETMHSILRPLA